MNLVKKGETTNCWNKFFFGISSVYIKSRNMMVREEL